MYSLTISILTLRYFCINKFTIAKFKELRNYFFELYSKKIDSVLRVVLIDIESKKCKEQYNKCIIDFYLLFVYFNL